MEWNADGLLKCFQELIIFVKTEKIDICLNWLWKNFTKKMWVKINEYQNCTIHSSNKARWRSAVAIKENLLYHEEFKIEEEALQATTMNI